MYIYNFCIACIVIILLTIRRQIHIIQLNSYNLDQQLLWYKKNLASFTFNISLLVSLVLYYEFKFIPANFVVIISIFGLLIENLPRKQKKKLVYTKRIIRLIFLCIVLFTPLIVPTYIYRSEYGLKFAVYALAFSPAIIFLAYLILLPIENSFRKKFTIEAKNIIKKNDRLYTIGVTGSFGKTSVKNYLYRLLSLKYYTCMTPESYNTAMGNTITIKKDLKNIHEIFISEMGARRVHDIEEICDIVFPNGAVITDVGNMHLDTFKSVDNVLKTKFELVDSVVKNVKKSAVVDKKIVLLNGDNEIIRKNAENYKDSGLYIYFYGLKDNNDFYATDIILGSSGTTFTFKAQDKKIPSIRIETTLLGNYNVKNLVAAISYAMLLGVDSDDIRNEIKKIEAVPHRLKLLAYDKNNLIIDDAYNSNPSGVKNAVDVLNSFDDYIKIIITPGMVELSDKQDMENENFAEYAGKYVDYALIVGDTNKSSLERGFKAKMTEDKVYCFLKVEEAIAFAKGISRDKKVILLENDLSDNY